MEAIVFLRFPAVWHRRLSASMFLYIENAEQSNPSDLLQMLFHYIPFFISFQKHLLSFKRNLNISPMESNSVNYFILLVSKFLFFFLIKTRGQPTPTGLNGNAMWKYQSVALFSFLSSHHQCSPHFTQHHCQKYLEYASWCHVVFTDSADVVQG